VEGGGVEGFDFGVDDGGVHVKSPG